MANPVYPTLAIDPKESQRLPRDGREEDYAGDGSGRVRKLYADKSDFTIKHPQLIAADVTTLLAFYAANPTVKIDFTWPEDGLVYTVVFGKGAIRSQWVSGTRRHFWVRLLGQ